MAHQTAFTRASTGHMFAHYERSAEHYSNENIDPERTHLNYNLASGDQPLSQIDFLHKRLDEVYCMNRKDVNVITDWVVTAPKDLPESEHADFFKHTYDFLCDRYGKENVVSAWVHKDEVNDHMHFCFIPVTYDAKKDRYKVSHKQVINIHDLDSFHPDLNKYLQEQMGHDVTVITGETATKGNRSVEQLKLDTLEERLEAAENDCEKAERKAAAAKKEYQDIVGDLNEVQKISKGWDPENWMPKPHPEETAVQFRKRLIPKIRSVIKAVVAHFVRPQEHTQAHNGNSTGEKQSVLNRLAENQDKIKMQDESRRQNKAHGQEHSGR